MPQQFDQIDERQGQTKHSEARKNQLDEELIEKLEKAFYPLSSEERCAHDLSKIVSEYSAIDLAYTALRLPLIQRMSLYHYFEGDEARADYLIIVDSSTRKGIFTQLINEQITSVIEKMPADEAIWVMGDLATARYRQILDSLSPKRAEHLLALQRYASNTAGRLMTNEFFAFEGKITISEVGTYIRENPNIDLLRRIFVLDQKGSLLGFVPARTLVIHSPDALLSQVMRPVSHTIAPDASRDDVVEIFERYKNSDLPVIGEEDRLVGVITYDDVMEAMEEIADETIGHITGTGHDLESYRPILRSVIMRMPWLFATLVAGIINAKSIAFFDPGFQLVTFIPLINGMSGNVGLQCSTVLVRGIATGLLSASAPWSAALRELMTGACSGLFFGVLAGFAAFALQMLSHHQVSVLAPLQLGLIVSTGLISTCVLATALGILFPLLFVKIGIDPAIASGPIVTAVNDTCSAILYTVIAYMMLGLFGVAR